MVGRVDKLKYADHDTNDLEKFPQFAPGKFLHTVTYRETNVTLVEVRQWASGLEQAGLLRMLNVPHFGRSPHVTGVVKQLLVLVHNEHLFIGAERIHINGELIHKITGLPWNGPNPATKFVGKSEDTTLAQEMKTRFHLTKGNRGYLTDGL